MDFIQSFHSIWDRVEAFKIDEPLSDEQAFWCGYAKEFSAWVNTWIISSKQDDLISLNQAKIILLDKYLEWRSFVPRSHQERVSVRGHTCIYQIFIQACEHLKIVELRLKKPMLFIPSPPVAAPRIEPRGPILFLDPVDD